MKSIIQLLIPLSLVIFILVFNSFLAVNKMEKMQESIEQNTRLIQEFSERKPLEEGEE